MEMLGHFTVVSTGSVLLHHHHLLTLIFKMLFIQVGFLICSQPENFTRMFLNKNTDVSISYLTQAVSFVGSPLIHVHDCTYLCVTTQRCAFKPPCTQTALENHDCGSPLPPTTCLAGLLTSPWIARIYLSTFCTNMELPK